MSECLSYRDNCMMKKHTNISNKRILCILIILRVVTGLSSYLLFSLETQTQQRRLVESGSALFDSALCPALSASSLAWKVGTRKLDITAFKIKQLSFTIMAKAMQSVEFLSYPVLLTRNRGAMSVFLTFFSWLCDCRRDSNFHY